MNSTQQHILAVLGSGATQAITIQAMLISEKRRNLSLADVYAELVALYDNGLVELLPRRRGSKASHLRWTRTQGVAA